MNTGFRIYNKSIGVCMLLLLALLPLSCIKDDSVSKETATVTMTFSTRAINSSVSSADDLEVNEHMRTLRVIVARQNGEILYNVKYGIAEGETSKSIKFSEMTVNAEGETFDFYAIANEDGVGYTGNWDNVTVTDLKGMNLQKEFLTKANNASTKTVIPQTAYKQIKVVPQSGGGIQTENMKLDFAVAKVRLTIHNTSAGDQYVKDIKLSGLNMDSTPLFAGKSLSTEKQGELSLGDLTIHADKSATVYAYFFENKDSNYALSASWNETTKTLDITHAVIPNITQISRGTALDINITLNATTTPTFNIGVVPWTTVEVDVPPFE